MDRIKQRALLAAVTSGLTGGFGGMFMGERYAPATERQRIQSDYPKCGLGKRQGERLQRQMDRLQLDYSASDRCIAAIKARI